MHDGARTDQLLGVLGGMGPVASAEFVQTVYGYATGVSEQEYPAVILHSDPSIPDRVALLADQAPEVVEPTQRGLRQLYEHGCTSIVICCMTLHHVLPQVPRSLRAGVASALDVLVDAIAAATPRRHLMMASTVARDIGLFRDHPGWPAVTPFVVWPDEADQAALQRVIRDVKQNNGIASGREWLASCLPKYATSSFAVGCSEIHVVAKKASVPGAWAIDPFDALARACAARTIHTIGAPR